MGGDDGPSAKALVKNTATAFHMAMYNNFKAVHALYTIKSEQSWVGDPFAPTPLR